MRRLEVSSRGFSKESSGSEGSRAYDRLAVNGCLKLAFGWRSTARGKDVAQSIQPAGLLRVVDQHREVVGGGRGQLRPAHRHLSRPPQRTEDGPHGDVSRRLEAPIPVSQKHRDVVGITVGHSQVLPPVPVRSRLRQQTTVSSRPRTSAEERHSLRQTHPPHQVLEPPIRAYRIESPIEAEPGHDEFACVIGSLQPAERVVFALKSCVIRSTTPGASSTDTTSCPRMTSVPQYTKSSPARPQSSPAFLDAFWTQFGPARQEAPPTTA